MNIISLRDNNNFYWLVLALLILAFILLIFWAPAEQTLGEVIRYVYIHVAFTKAGLWGYYLAGLLGIVILISGNSNLQNFTQVVAWVALVLFILGGIVSIAAGFASWGGFPLDEPRNRTMLSAIAFALVVLILNHWLPWIRLRGLLYSMLAGYIAWTIPNTPLVLHPGDAGGASTSVAIRWTFILLPVLAFLIGAWFVWYFSRRLDK
ncbi:MAG: hypothetical protein R3293_27565 [Candidatus Promineifilaceae bacterium]|nr:hypothetical protein [Candidatus Promineifilaceae bacterium]